MATIDVNGTLIDFPDDLSPDQLQAAVAQAASQMDQSPKKNGSILDGYQNSQFGSPSQLLQMIPELASKLANKSGTFAAEELARRGMNPNISAGIGTVAAMAPDIAMASINPMRGAAQSIPGLAAVVERRALGLASPELTTTFGRKKSAVAARTMLEQGVRSATGSPQVLFDKASALKNTVGEKIGKIRESVGPQPVDKFIDALDNYKSTRLKGANGGVFDKISAKIEEAKDTIKGLLGEKSSSSLRKIPGNPGIEGQRNLATGFMEGEISATNKALVGGGQRFDIMGGSKPSPKIGLDRIADAKKELGKLVNWFSDNLSQSESKSINRVIENALESSISEAGGDIKSYRELKPIYGAAKTALKGLNRELGKQQGNMAIGLPALVAGASGGPAAALKVGAFEGARRRGAGVAANELMGLANSPSKLGIPVINSLNTLKRSLTEDRAREYLRKSKNNPEKARRMAKEDGYTID